MAEERVQPRENTWQRWLPWAEIFRAFWVALDLNNLLLAAGGILVMWLFWVFWSLIFSAGEKPVPPDWGEAGGNYTSRADVPKSEAWLQFRRDRQAWNLMHEAAGVGSSTESVYEISDIAETLDEYDLVRDAVKTATGDAAVQAVRSLADRMDQEGKKAEASRLRSRAPRYALVGRVKPAGRLSVSPWAEDRGPNPVLLVTGQAGIPWEAGHFVEWFISDQVPVMLEPLYKLGRPVVYLLSPRNTFLSRVYFLFVTLSTLVIWSIFGGAITRRVVVQLATGEKIFATEALGFTFRHFGAYLTAPLIPLAIVFAIMVILFFFGLVHLIPVVGDFFSGLLWPVPLILGLIMAVLLVGLVAWPLMAATISADGSDGWEAFTRAYGCLFERPWHCAWYSIVALAYGGVVIFFVGFISSLMVYLADWGVDQAPRLVAESRETSFLFVYAPRSFGWRELLLEGTKVQPTADDIKRYPELQGLVGAEVVRPRDALGPRIGQVGGASRYDRINPEAYNGYLRTLATWNKIGAWLVAFWLGLAFLLVLGFGYALFWTVTSIIYLLLRRGLDTSEMDDVYMEQEEFTNFRMPPAAATPATSSPAATPAAPAKPGTSLSIVEAPRAPASVELNKTSPLANPPTLNPSPAPVSTPSPGPAPAVSPTPEPTLPSAPLSSAKPADEEPPAHPEA